jgi:hypothetical protein
MSDEDPLESLLPEETIARIRQIVLTILLRLSPSCDSVSSQLAGTSQRLRKPSRLCRSQQLVSAGAPQIWHDTFQNVSKKARNS